MESADGEHAFWLNSRLHVDGIFHLSDEDYPHAFQVRRARLESNATLFRGFLSLALGMEFGRTRSANARDAFVNIKPHDAFQLRVGQQRLPFSTERLTSSNYMKHPERPIVVDQLVAQRDIGATLWGRLLDEGAEYQAGVYNGDGENTSGDTNGAFDFAGRIVITALESLQLSASYRYSPANDESSGVSDAGTVGGQVTAFLDYDQDNLERGGGRHRVSAGPLFRFRFFEFKSEFLLDWLANLSVGDPDTGTTQVAESLLNWSAFADASVVLTGEENTGKDIKPARSIGAWELNLRYEYYHADPKALEIGAATGANVVNSFTGTVIWTAAPGFRALLSYTYSHFNDRVLEVDGSSAQNDRVLLMRTDLHF